MLPHARDNAPWSGPAHLMQDGTLYGYPAAQGALALFFDKDQRHHCATVFFADEVGDEYVWGNRRFSVVRVEAGR